MTASGRQKETRTRRGERRGAGDGVGGDQRQGRERGKERKEGGGGKRGKAERALGEV